MRIPLTTTIKSIMLSRIYGPGVVVSHKCCTINSNTVVLLATDVHWLRGRWGYTYILRRNSCHNSTTYVDSKYTVRRVGSHYR